MPQLLLTDIAIRALKPIDGRTDYWDTKTSGFGVRVGPRNKTFIVKHQNRWYTVGHYPDLALVDARKKAKTLLASEPEPSTLTFSDAYNRFLTTHCAKVRPRTKRDYERSLKTHFLPKLRKMRLAEITTDRVSKIVTDLSDTPVEAFHAFAVARTFFRWAVSMRYLKVSPLYGIPAPRANSPRQRVLSDVELRKVWTAAGETGGNFGAIVKLLVLTGQRRGEIAALQKSWIKEDTITLPAEITKNRREHTFPIASFCASMVTSALPPKGHTFLFLARGKTDTPFNGWSKAKAELDEKSGVSDWTLHDIRRTVASNLAALGVQLPVIERLLNHVSGSFGGIVSVYQKHSFMPEMRAAVEKYESWLLELLAH